MTTQHARLTLTLAACTTIAVVLGMLAAQMWRLS